jgi:uracil-DNA glycosylase family protein
VTAETTSWDAAPFVPVSRRLKVLVEAARQCTGCPLYRAATQTVFGRGPASASLVLVGEQPGEREDVDGQAFVGPAGRVLWQCAAAAGLEPDDMYVTNAVKHFKHEVRGKRRIHQRPTTAEINACQPWLAAELEAVAGTVVVALGATAARALFGKTLGIASNRGRPLPLGERLAFVTYHPSAVLRGDERADELRAALVDDLAAARQAVGSTPERVVTTDG